MKIGFDEVQKNGLKICVDWLSFSFPDSFPLNGVFDLMGYSVASFQSMPKGRYGYRSHLKHPVYDISVLYDGREDMGIHVDVSGSAIQDLLSHFYNSRVSLTPFGDGAYETTDFDSTVFTDLLKGILASGRITRLDLAIDDIGCHYFSLSALDSKLSSKSYVSKFRKWRKLIEYENGSDIVGYTIYMGSRASAVMLRVYDKQLEQNRKLAKTSQSLILHPWVRWELELKDEYACKAADALVRQNSLNAVAVGILSSYLRIVTLDASRITNCSVDSVWTSFIGDVSKLALYQAPAEKTIDDTRNWILHQCSSGMAAIVIADGGDLSFLHRAIQVGSSKLPAHYISKIRRYQTG